MLFRHKMIRLLAFIALISGLTMAAKPTTSPNQILVLSATSEVGLYIPGQSEPDQWTCQEFGTCVINPTHGECIWGIDDSLSISGQGKLLPGTISHTSCIYSDDHVRLNRATVTSKSPDLIVTIRFEPSGLERTYSPRWNAALSHWSYGECIQGPTYQLASMQLIPGSNGGYAVPGTITFTVTNPTDRYIRDTYAGFGIRQSSGTWREAMCLNENLGVSFTYGGAAWKEPVS